MRFRGFIIDVPNSCTNLGLSKEDWSPIREHAEVLSLYCNEKMRRVNCDGGNATGAVFYVSSPDKPETFFFDSNTLFLGWHLRPDLWPAKETRSIQIFDMLVQFARAGILKAEGILDSDLYPIKDLLRAFPNDGYVAEHVLCERRPRGLGVTFRIECQMTPLHLDVFFVCLCAEQEVFREVVQRTKPSAIFLKRRFKKILVEDGRVSIEGKIIWPGDATDRPRRQQERYPCRGPNDKLAYYEWSRSLGEVIHPRLPS